MKIFPALVLFFLVQLAQAADPHCQPLSSPLPGSQGQLCIYPGEQNSDVLFYLHGLDASAETWGDTGFWSQQLRDYWRDHGQAAPTVVSVSLGKRWLLSPKTGAPKGLGLLDFFTAQVMPEIEAKLGGVKGRRLLLGDSMGGFNSLQLGMKTTLFAKVAALCAPISDGTVGPFSPIDEVSAFIKRSAAFRSKHHTELELQASFAMIRFVLSQYWTQQEWPASDPLELARAQRGPLAARFYLAAGYYDHYMTYEGNAAFAQLLEKSGTAVEWRPQWGGHCAIDIPTLAEFLVK